MFALQTGERGGTSPRGNIHANAVDEDNADAARCWDSLQKVKPQSLRVTVSVPLPF
jgi:hypothetical protein